MSPRALGYAALVAILCFAVPARSDPALERGIQLFEQGKYDEARTALTPLAPASADASFYLGRVAMRQNDPKEAAHRFEAAVEGRSNDAKYHLWLGRAYGQQARRANKLSALGLAKKCLREFERASALDPDLIEARSDLVDYYIQAPGFAGGSVAKAKLQCEEIRKRDPYQALLIEAKIAQHEEDQAKAERSLIAATKLEPDSTQARYALGMFYSDIERYDLAFDVFEAILASKPHDSEALYVIGRTGAVSGQRLDRAQAVLEEYLTLPQPANGRSPAMAHWRLGMVHERAGRTDKARQEYRKALEIDPKHDDAKKSLAKLK